MRDVTSLRLGWLALVAAVLAATSARAQGWLDSPGVLGTQTVTVGHATVTLPPGTWKEIAAGDDTPLQQGGESLSISQKILVEVQDGRIAAAISVRSNETRSRWGWRAANQCAWRDRVWSDNASESNRNYDCMVVDHWLMKLGSNPSPIWEAAYDVAETFKGWPAPMVGVRFGLTSSSRLDFIDMTVLVDPGRYGQTSKPAASWNESDWHRNLITPAHRAFVEKVAAWARAYHATVANAF